ncbi:MAG: sulfatase-like hydrolase/transferase, partial [Geminicoccaceae bacterium]
EPLFLYVLPYSPHSPSVAAPRHLGMFEDAPLPRTAAFDEPDVGGKPMLIRSLPRLDDERIASLTDEYRRRLASLQGVDDMVERIVDALKSAGMLQSTYVIYSSDNGFHLGEHRLPAGKDTAYEEDLRVPMVMRGPGVPKGGRIDAMVLNIDFAPTFAEMAGAAPPDFVDGRSFLPLLDDPDARWRRSFLVERRALEVQLKELAASRGMSAKELAASAYLSGLRTADRTYVEYGTGERELYDLRADRFQIDNVVDEADPALVAALSGRLAALEGCAGEECRRLEDLPIGPAQGLLAEKAPAAKVVPASATR